MNIEFLSHVMLIGFTFEQSDYQRIEMVAVYNNLRISPDEVREFIHELTICPHATHPKIQVMSRETYRNIFEANINNHS